MSLQVVSRHKLLRQSNMKKILRKALRKLYYFAFPEEQFTDGLRTVDCILGEGSRIYERSRIYNPSIHKENITIGKQTHIAGDLYVWANAGNIVIGDWSFVGENTRIYSAKQISIGNRVQIAHGCNIFDCNIHSLNPVERHNEYIQNITGVLEKLYSLNEKEVIIEDDAWLGACVIVLKGVKIGRGAIVGAGSVVTQDIPEYTIAVGNPAQVIRTIIH